MTIFKDRDYDPEKPFDGLTIREWLRVVFVTRAQTIKRFDEVSSRIMEVNQITLQELRSSTELLKRLGAALLLQHTALEAVDEYVLPHSKNPYPLTDSPEYYKARELVKEALKAALEKPLW